MQGRNGAGPPFFQQQAAAKRSLAKWQQQNSRPHDRTNFKGAKVLHFNFARPVAGDPIRRSRFHSRAKRQLRKFVKIITKDRGWPGSRRQKDYPIVVNKHASPSGKTTLQSEMLFVRISQGQGGLTLRVQGEEFKLPLQMLKDPQQMAAAVRNRVPHVFGHRKEEACRST